MKILLEEKDFRICYEDQDDNEIYIVKKKGLGNKRVRELNRILRDYKLKNENEYKCVHSCEDCK